MPYINSILEIKYLTIVDTLIDIRSYFIQAKILYGMYYKLYCIVPIYYPLIGRISGGEFSIIIYR